MKGSRFLVWLAVVLILIGFTLTARAEPVSDAQMKEACQYAADHLVKSRAVIPLPNKVQEEGNERFYRDLAIFRPAADPQRVVVFYMPGRMYILQSFNPSQMQYLVHECVHHVQMVMGYKYPCWDAREREAYQIQNQYANDNNQRIFMSEERIEQLSACKGVPNFAQ